MPHHTPLIGTIVAGLVVAFIMGAIAHRLRISPVAGYLLAGVLVGPFTPGYVADTSLANELAEIGVILLMFGVGLHFSLRDLLSVKHIAVPGAVIQIATATAMGTGLALWLGWSVPAGLVFGLALSVASTVVLLRAMQSRNLVETERGRIAIGWLIVEDLAMVLALVLLPAFGGLFSGEADAQQDLLLTLGVTILKVAGFVALMLVVGKRVIPFVLHWTAHTGSRELFRLAVLAIALGVAYGAALIFDVSFALGAFFAGMILGETHLSKRATEETLPLRDAFAVLFFVSVGMLFNPATVTEQPVPVLLTVLIIVVGKSLAAWAIVRMFRHDNKTALIIAASLAQIGEFSFILAGLGAGLGLLPPEGRDLILAGAIFSILLNPFIFNAMMRLRGESTPPPAEEPALDLHQKHAILVGHGRVGSLVAAGRTDEVVVIEEEAGNARLAGATGREVIRGNAASAEVLERAGIRDASTIIIAIPEGFEGGAVAELARQLNPQIKIIARAHSDAEVEHLKQMGADHVVMGEQEIARTILGLSPTTRRKD